LAKPATVSVSADHGTLGPVDLGISPEAQEFASRGYEALGSFEGVTFWYLLRQNEFGWRREFVPSLDRRHFALKHGFFSTLLVSDPCAELPEFEQRIALSAAVNPAGKLEGDYIDTSYPLKCTGRPSRVRVEGFSKVQKWK
jgi:hypothetical protein